MRFSNAMQLVEIANTNITASKSHQTNESPRNHLSNAVKSAPPRATLIRMMPKNCQRVADLEGTDVMQAILHDLWRTGSGLLGEA